MLEQLSPPTRGRGLKLMLSQVLLRFRLGRPHAGAWIETLRRALAQHRADRVAPHAGAWIETFLPVAASLDRRVAPHAGAWIETGLAPGPRDAVLVVAPYAGAWIETCQSR